MEQGSGGEAPDWNQQWLCHELGTSPSLAMKQAWRQRTRPRSHRATCRVGLDVKALVPSGDKISSSFIHLSLDRLGCQACPQQASTFSLVEAAVPPSCYL